MLVDDPEIEAGRVSRIRENVGRRIGAAAVGVARGTGGRRLSAVGPIRVRVRGAVVVVVREAGLERRVLLHFAARERLGARAQIGCSFLRHRIVDDDLVVRRERLVSRLDLDPVVLDRRVDLRGEAILDEAASERVAIAPRGNEVSGVVTSVPVILRHRCAILRDSRAAAQRDHSLPTFDSLDLELPRHHAIPSGVRCAVVRENREEPHCAELTRMLRGKPVRIRSDEGDEVRVAVVVLLLLCEERRGKQSQGKKCGGNGTHG